MEIVMLITTQTYIHITNICFDYIVSFQYNKNHNKKFKLHTTLSSSINKTPCRVLLTVSININLDFF